MENNNSKNPKNLSPGNNLDALDLTQKLLELESKKIELEETIKAREEQLLNLFSYIQTAAK